MHSQFSFQASINAGSLISTFLTPLLRNKKCDGRDTCFPLAFGVPAALFLVAILAFLGGRVCKSFQSNIYQKSQSFYFVKYGSSNIMSIVPSKNCSDVLSFQMYFLKQKAILAFFYCFGSNLKTKVNVYNQQLNI